MAKKAVPKTSGPATTPRELQISDELRQALADMRWLEEQTAPPELDLAELGRAEAALGIEFRDDVLAFFASGRKGSGVGFLGTRPEDLLEHQESARMARGKQDEDRIILELSDTPPAWELMCIVPGPGRDTSVQVRNLWDEPLGPPMTFTRWVADLAGKLIGEERRGPAEVSALRPRLVCAPAVSLGRVRHASFGDGHVVGSQGDSVSTKLHIVFDDGVKRVVLARFVTELDR